eukprot:TRINITY_DN853_c0_g1_i1.p1 TRINITY_DN853_c0_g1~~TRINITY_DN853_c0_g1_i1.p1  ORF type:complete len:126 (-),score=38.81 TRINITY_DN853_c0_g1_i1:76-453(-)
MSGREALILYKTLHRTVQKVFRGDMPAMLAARDKVCEEFTKNRNVQSETSIAELVNQGYEVQKILDQSVVQLQKKDEEKFQMNIRDETYMFENNPFRDDITAEEYKMANRRSRKKGGKCDDAKKE